MATTQTVIIDFQADFTSLETGIDSLEKMGKVDKDVADQFRKTNTEIKRQGDALTATANKVPVATQNYTKLSNTVKDFARNGVGKLVVSAMDLKNAGVNVDLFFKKAKEGNELVVPKFDSLRLQLAEVRKRMEQAAIVSGVLSKEYLALKEQAGALSNAIRDINSDIKNTGSDTRKIDNVVGSISALAGGFSAVQGAQALFGEGSEDLQKALLKVNGAMAISTGLQQILNATTKTGSLTRLADATATGFQIATQKIYTFVTGQATVATTAFKVALASTGIGLLVIGLVALISNMGGASRATRKFKKDLEALRSGTDAAIEAIQKEGEINTLLLEQQGVTQSKISKQKIKDLQDQQTLEEGMLIKLEADRTKAKRNFKDDSIAEVVISQNKIKLIDEQIKTSEKNLRERRDKIKADTIKAQTEENQEREQAAKDAAAIASEAGKKALEAARKRRALEFEDFQAGIELKLLATEKGSAEELDLQKQLLRAKLQIDLEGEDLTLNQRRLLIQQFFKDRLELEKTFNKALLSASLEDQKNRDAAILENLNLTEEEKLAVKIEYLQLGAAQEILSADGNAAKILAINAKLNSDITAAKVASIKAASDYEIALQSAQGGGARRALEAVASNEKMKSEVRINAILQLADREQQVLNKQIKANRDAAAVIGSDQKSLALEYQQLLDQKAAATEATEKKITAITETENEKRRQSDIANINMTLSALQEVNSIIGEFQNNANQRLSDEIKGRRKAVEDLLEAGAITEKDAKERNRKLDIEERNARIKSAQQQKSLAVFSAFITGAQAIMQAIASAPPPLNVPAIILTSALVAAQIAAIASRPIPKFATGKKGSYKGFGEVGEAGAELIQRADGRMEVATRRSMVYLGAQDKVFTAGETKRMMPFVNKEAISATGKSFQFDYNKMAKAVNHKGNSTVVNIDKEFISESVANGLSRVNYFDRYYSSK